MQTEERAAGQVVAGRYVLAERLGAGGMAEVRAAHDERLARPVAVKLLRPHLAEEPGARRRFETEARAAARLSHPNIVTIFDTGEDSGVPFIVMEHVPGGTLAREIGDGPMPLDRVIAVADAVLWALAVAHAAGIVHRDVKPGNVLLTEERVPKVTDFGIAKVTEYSGGATATTTGELLATPAYMAPERLTGAPSTPASDLYSVGVLLYEMLAGARPFRGATPAAVLDAVARGAYEPLRARRPDVPEALARVVDRAMARDAALRFPSAENMAWALADARGGAGEDATVAEDRLARDRPVPARDETTPTTRTLRVPPRLATSTAGKRASGAPASGTSPRRSAGRPRFPRWAVLTAVALVVTAIIVVAGLLLSGGAPVPTAPEGDPAATVTGDDSGLPPADLFLPAPLDEAIEQLEDAVSR